MSLIFGTEAFVVLKDIWGLDRQRAQDVALWTCHALIDAALRQETGRQAVQRRSAVTKRRSGQE